MSVLSKPYFHDEEAAFAHVEAVLWQGEPVCPHCGSLGKHYDLRKTRIGLRKCQDCRKQFTVRVGTVFESSHVPLHKWLQAVHLMCSSKKGISAHQLHRILEVTYKTAWFMAHRLREAMRDGNPSPMGGEGKIVEADETYFGNVKESRPSDVFMSGKGWVKRDGGLGTKMKVIALVERGGNVRSVKVDHITANTVRDIVTANVKRETALMTDEANVYIKVGREFASHDTVNHGDKEYGRGIVYTNTIEGVFSIFKRGMKGVYQHCSEKHLHRYLAEFDFRYNNRSALGVEDQQRASRALSGIVGKRLTYRVSLGVGGA